MSPGGLRPGKVKEASKAGKAGEVGQLTLIHTEQVEAVLWDQDSASEPQCLQL